MSGYALYAVLVLVFTLGFVVGVAFSRMPAQ